MVFLFMWVRVDDNIRFDFSSYVYSAFQLLSCLYIEPIPANYPASPDLIPKEPLDFEEVEELGLHCEQGDKPLLFASSTLIDSDTFFT